MASFGWSALNSLLGRGAKALPWQPPEACWSRPFGLGWDKPYTVRYASNLDDGPNHGMPLGGFGAGCFGRAPDGNINLWHLDGGEHWFGVLPDCQFALFEGNERGKRAHALAVQPDQDASRPEAGQPLKAWTWYPASTPERSTGTYAARYPLSWTSYEGVYDAEVRCEAFSPILPGDYQRTSYPVAVFVWTLRNPTDQPLDLSLLLSWRNSTGWFTNTDASAEVHFRDDGSPEHNYAPAIGKTNGQRNRCIEDGSLKGVVLEGNVSKPVAEGEGQWCIATAEQPGVTIQRCSRWNPSGDGRELWDSFSVDGSIPESNNDRRSGSDDPLSAALAVQCQLAPGQSIEIPVVISWDLPVTAFATGSQALRRYTDFFGADGNQAVAIAAEALRDWQTPGASRLRPGSSRCCNARTCRSRCGWLCSMSSTTSAVAAVSGARPHPMIPTAASAFWSASTTPGTRALMFVFMDPLLCCSSGLNWTRPCCAVLPEPFRRQMPPSGRSVGTSPRAKAGLRPIAR